VGENVDVIKYPINGTISEKLDYIKLIHELGISTSMDNDDIIR